MLFHWAVSNLNIQIHVTIHKQSNTSVISTNATYTTCTNIISNTNTNSNTKTKKKTYTTTYCIIKSYWTLEGIGKGEGSLLNSGSPLFEMGLGLIQN